MKRLRIYVWFAAFVFLANAWLCYAFSSTNIFSSNQSPLWQRVLTDIALISQLPSLPLSRIVADWFGVSYPGWALATSVISVLIYFPLIHLSRPWTPRVGVRSIRRKVAAFSSSLNPCVPTRKRVKEPAPNSNEGSPGSAAPTQAVAKLSSKTLDFPDASSVAVLTSPSHTLIGS
jgi:hypothetical protein